MSTADALIDVEELAAAVRRVAAQYTTPGSAAASGTAAPDMAGSGVAAPSVAAQGPDDESAAAAGAAAEGAAGGSGPAPQLVIVDVRWRLGGPPPAQLYAAGHLPGAVVVDLDSDLAAPVGDGRRGRHPLPEPEALQAALRRWGIRADSSVVAYDEADGTSAARAWWLLRWAGLQDVRVLNGGIAAWTAAGLPLTTDVPVPEPGDVVVRPGRMPVLDADAAAALAAGNGVLLDARAEARYRGEVEPVDPVAGHIPGARSAPGSGNVDASGRFLSPERLRERFAGLGVGPGRRVGAYCGSGVTAAQEVLALELAGVRAELYPGSWSEWVADRTRPVETGPDTGSQVR